MKRKYCDYSQEQKERYIQRCTDRRWKRRTKLLKFFDSKCSICGYNKCIAALEFHHRDPKTKLFSLNVREIASKTWETLVKESKKCELLCSNCHREVEFAKETKYPRNYK